MTKAQAELARGTEAERSNSDPENQGGKNLALEGVQGFGGLGRERRGARLGAESLSRWPAGGPWRWACAPARAGPREGGQEGSKGRRKQGRKEGPRGQGGQPDASAASLLQETKQSVAPCLPS